MSVPCIVCGTFAEPQQVSAAQAALHWKCPRCGEFVLTGTAAVVLPRQLAANPDAPSIVSHLLRLKFENSGSPVALTTYDYDFYQTQRLPNPQEQADNLLLWMGRAQRMPQQVIEIEDNRLAAIVGCAIGENTAAELGLDWLFGQIESEYWIESGLARAVPPWRRWALRLTIGGWSKYQELSRIERASMSAFMAMSFRPTEIELMDKVLADCFRPAAKRAGFDLQKVTDGQGAGLIDNQIRVAIRKARFVVADLTHDNNGAYFEAGFAEGLGIPVMYTCEAGKFEARRTHFDTNHMNTVPWALDNLIAAGEALTAMIRNTLPTIALLEG